MPEYLAPGVYVEETSFRAKSIEGVSTTTTGFIGPTRYGPVELEPDIVTSLGEFERLYGDGEPLKFGPEQADNYMWQAARAFYTEGGKRLYASRVFRPLDDSVYPPANFANAARNPEGLYPDGHARQQVGRVTFRARYPGQAGNLLIRVQLRASQNILGFVREDDGDKATLGALQERDVVWIRDETSPLLSPLDQEGDFWIAERNIQQSPPVLDSRTPGYWQFQGAVGSPISSPLETKWFGSDALPDPVPGEGISIRILTLTIEVFAPDGSALGIWAGLPLDPGHRTAGMDDAMTAVFGPEPEYRQLPIVIDIQAGSNGLDVLDNLFGLHPNVRNGTELLKGLTRDVTLEGGNDGLGPGAKEYEGQDKEELSYKTGLKQFEDLEDISIVAAPGSMWKYMYDEQRRGEANTIIGLLLAHAQKMRYRIAVIDSAQGQTVADVRKMRAKLDSKYGALYYPWIKILDPVTRRELYLPPSGFVAGVYARNDINRAVYKAPANEVINLALGFELMLNKAQQEVLNPEGINCFRFFEGRGMLLWGARTISSDPEWKYVNLRRYFAYLERSIDRGTQWAVFEPNGDALWANVRRTIEDFLFNEWQMGALLGDKPERAYFVKCDRTTMTQNDLDNGRLVCLIGVAPLRPAEFVIFRIGQWTGDRRV